MAKQLRCPGQDQRFWKPDDIYDIICPNCGNELEFWKDDPYHTCPQCKIIVRNPKIDSGCTAWCKHSNDCLLGELS